jgi:hypothetical protein
MDQRNWRSKFRSSPRDISMSFCLFANCVQDADDKAPSNPTLLEIHGQGNTENVMEIQSLLKLGLVAQTYVRSNPPYFIPTDCTAALPRSGLRAVASGARKMKRKRSWTREINPALLTLGSRAKKKKKIGASQDWRKNGIRECDMRYHWFHCRKVGGSLFSGFSSGIDAVHSDSFLKKWSGRGTQQMCFVLSWF